MKSKEENILNLITDFYLKSRDFNGYPARLLLEKESDVSIIDTIRTLIVDEKIEIVYGNYHPNPHIKALKCEPKQEQISKLNTDLLAQSCIYPSKSHLKNVVNVNDYSDRPYTLELKLGEPKLDFRPFDLSILEVYRNDPRYNYENDDIRGSIVISDEYYKSNEMDEKDKILLETFGFSYNDKFQRAVAVFLCYLARLSPEHQKLWKTKELEMGYKLHPDYYNNSILGSWKSGITIFEAFVYELQVINKMALAMQGSRLFRDDFTNGKPQLFAFLLRPTLREYNDFIHLLDKMISDNICREFFNNEVSCEMECPRNDGKIIVKSKGTIKMLEEWLLKYYKADEESLKKYIFDIFRKIRKLRQNPAHAVNENKFDQQYFTLQREIMIETYEAIRDIRKIFSRHPCVQRASIKIPSALEKNTIWTQ